MTITKRTSRANVAGGPTSITRKKKDEKKQNWITVKKTYLTKLMKKNPHAETIKIKA